MYHQMAQDAMLIQGMHYAVEEALASVGELSSPDPPHDPRSRCLLRLQQNLIDIARILENVQERTVHNITNHASTPQAPIVVEEEQTPQPIIGSPGNDHLPTPPIPVRSYIQDSAEVVMFRPEPLPHRSDSKAVTPPPPSENLMPLTQATLGRGSKRRADEGDNHTAQPPPAKRPRRSLNGPIYLRPAHERREEQSSVLGWARRMFFVLGQ